MTSLQQRAFTGIILVTILLGATILGVFAFATIIMLLNLLALAEFYTLFKLFTASPRKEMGLLLSLGLMASLLLFVAGIADRQIFFALLPLVFAIFVVELFLKSTSPIQNLAIILLGILVITIPFSFFILAAILPIGSGIFPYFVIGYFIILWAIDSGAFLVGKTMGRNLLFPRISPMKTWEGLAGGLAFGLLAAFVIAEYFPVFPLARWITLTLVIFVTGTFGDFIKSMMKRSLGVKDSGTILPGHGGILDRFDTLLGSAPFVFAYLELAGRLRQGVLP